MGHLHRRSSRSSRATCIPRSPGLTEQPAGTAPATVAVQSRITAIRWTHPPNSGQWPVRDAGDSEPTVKTSEPYAGGSAWGADDDDSVRQRRPDQCLRPMTGAFKGQLQTATGKPTTDSGLWAARVRQRHNRNTSGLTLRRRYRQLLPRTLWPHPPKLKAPQEQEPFVMTRPTP
jgi:hypothetical protein